MSSEAKKTARALSNLFEDITYEDNKIRPAKKLKQTHQTVSTQSQYLEANNLKRLTRFSFIQRQSTREQVKIIFLNLKKIIEKFLR